ncbi:MAG: hypothetical protein AUG44_27765 [Actinobacteria bacterium 13_1_20CM_3_71_11]|nr:MAG: hypothetical protein AUG44_27765 [Actinobacteria bacterium 13_1_20CM_3_71_11]TML31871.1 MAG: hypothetical protein E6G35_03410 [Actinomycetota bacterium]
MYSLVSTPVLGFDLTRLGGGSATAEVLLRGLCLSEWDLPILARRLPGEDVRGPLWLEVEAAGRQLTTVRTAATVEDALRAMAIVERAPIGTVDGLLHCVRHDVLAWTWVTREGVARQAPVAEKAAGVLCDAAVSSYLRDQLPDPVRRGLAAAWVGALRQLPASQPIDLGPHHHTVTALLDRVRTVSSHEVHRLLRAADDSRTAPSGWASAVHSASWGAYLSGRTRTAAAAQLLLVQAVDTGAVPLADRAAGVWNVLSGAVQALVVRDLLDGATAHRLLAPVLAALGPGWLR